MRSRSGALRFLRVQSFALLLAALACVSDGQGGLSSSGAPNSRSLSASSLLAQAVSPGAVDLATLGRIDETVERAIADGDLPGAVVLVWHRGRTLFHEAYGQRSVVPVREPMTTDTVFDLASLTKAVATTTAVMMLVEEGRIRLRDRVDLYLPGFARHDKARITIEHLLAHVSGLRPDFPLEDEFSGSEVAIERTLDERPVAEPGEEFIYSDINFILLGEIVARVSGMSLDTFVRQRIFEPLGMDDTTFSPPESVRGRVAPTEACWPLGWPCGQPDASMLRGQVHDPTARRMGGVAGHAGLFGTSSDLARFGEMMLSGGSLDGARLLSPATVARMTSRATPAAIGDVRGLGWDIDSRYSSNRGDLFSTGSYGHTGFTGTSIWLDPATQTVVVFLSNRVHPDGEGNVTVLRSRVATLAAAAVRRVDFGSPDAADVLTGVDRLERDLFGTLAGQRVGLVTNQTGRTRSGVTTLDLLHQAPEVDLRRLFSPEHGMRGELDTQVADDLDPVTGLTIYSLYGNTRRPTAAMLEGLDVMVIDLQDVGARFYTYATTMAYVMESAAKQGLRVVVLDRPNPVNGLAVEGPVLDESARGFTGYHSMPVRHGLTLGELAMVFNDEREIQVELEVVAMEGWRRELWFDETGVPWVSPSPNLRTVGQTVLYPGIGAIEGTNISVGRGTDTPFEQIGAPWVEGVRLSRFLNDRGLPGVRFYPVEFRPTSSAFAHELCRGVHLIVTNRDVLRPVRVGLEIAAALHLLHAAAFDLDAAARLLGSQDALDRIKAGDDPADIAASWSEEEREWRGRVAPFLLYRP